MKQIMTISAALLFLTIGEVQAQNGIEQVLKGRTSFVIAHRLSTIKKADRIFVVEGGRIIEEGVAGKRATDYLAEAGSQNG